MPIDVKETSNSAQTRFDLIGTLDEKATLPIRTNTNVLILNFADITNINSIGVRNFIIWGEKHSRVPVIQLENCPPIFVKNFTGIFGFLKPNMDIISFFTPFYNDKTNEAKDVQFLSGREFNEKGLMEIPIVKDSQGNRMELDVAESYFAFLNK